MDESKPPIRRRATDERGRLIPITEEELRRRNEEAIKTLDAISEMGTEDERQETLEFLAEAFGPERFRLD